MNAFGWKWTGKQRPPFAIQPAAGQESCWDFPRPPAIREDKRTAIVKTKSGSEIARSNRALRVCETAAPPTWYFPPDCVKQDLLSKVLGKSSYCEWKGKATYWSLSDNVPVAWSYENPNEDFKRITGHFAFYASKFDCFVGDEKVVPQASDFYGGWITSDVVGPFKGDPGVTEM